MSPQWAVYNILACNVPQSLELFNNRYIVITGILLVYAFFSYF